MIPSSIAHIMAAAAAMSGGFGAMDMGGRYAPSYRPKTLSVPRDDAGHIAAAEAKRRRKVAKKVPTNPQP